jgi:triacylglycerol lipase
MVGVFSPLEVTMSQIQGDGSNSDAQLALTFAAVAQCPDIADSVAKNAPGWTCAWQPTAAINGNLAYIAYNGSSQYVVAIRGSILSFSWGSFDNWFEQDFNVFFQSDWVYPASSAKPKISRGSNDGLNDLISLKDENGVDLLTFLVTNAISNKMSIAVVGHSLGGNLTTVLAPWLVYQLQQQQQAVPSPFPVYTFAAPTAGNKAFADAYDAMFPNSYRYYNEADIVPKASSPVSVASMGLLYSPSPEAISISVTYDDKTVNLAEAVGLVAAAIGASEVTNDFSYYTQTNQTRGSVALNTNLSLFTVSSGSLIDEWFEQALAQHETPAYFKFLGGTPITCVTSS